MTIFRRLTYLLWLFLSIVSIIGCFLTPILVYLLKAQPEPTPWRKETSPLNIETVVEICQTFMLTQEHFLCHPGKEIYADQFFPIIKEALPINQVTFDEVEEKLGKYQVRKEESVYVSSGGYSYYRVWYDLKGDGVTAIVYDFYEDGKAFDTSIHLGSGDP